MNIMLHFVIFLSDRKENVCLFIVLRHAQEFFYGDVTITGEGLHNLGPCLALKAF
jgi:hypothetical protein